MKTKKKTKNPIDKFMDNIMQYYSLSQEAIQATLNRQTNDNNNIELYTKEITELLKKAHAHSQESIYQDCIKYSQNNMQLTNWFLKKISGEDAEEIYHPEKSDHRFDNEVWSHNPIFSYIKQYNLMHCQNMKNMVDNLTGVDSTTKKKLMFYVKLANDTLSPDNYVMTNPEVLQTTIESQGNNLIQGMHNLVHDLKNNKSFIPISTCDQTAFEVGKNIAITEGQVIYENEVMQLIWYKPKSHSYQVPILIVPPCIGKYYIMDLQQHNSAIKWLVDNNYQVFNISWVNPTKKHAHLSLEQYVDLGVLEAIRQIQLITSQNKINAIGYCIGGTILTIAAAYLKKSSDKILGNVLNSITLMASFIDFQHTNKTTAGVLDILYDDNITDQLIAYIKSQGYLDKYNLTAVLTIHICSIKEMKVNRNFSHFLAF